MTAFAVTSDRFTTEDGVRVVVQVPDPSCQALIDRVLQETALPYGDYDRVTFQSQPGRQQFRSTGSGRNAATDGVVAVPCVELSFFLPDEPALISRVLTALYDAHPYEEPVIFVAPCQRALHVRGRDEDNPNRFWNAPPADWVPGDHR